MCAYTIITVIIVFAIIYSTRQVAVDWMFVFPQIHMLKPQCGGVWRRVTGHENGAPQMGLASLQEKDRGEPFLYLWAMWGVGLHPAGLQALYLPSPKTKGRAQSQWQRHQWFNGWGSLCVWNKVLERHPIVGGRQPAGLGGILSSWGKGKVTSYRGS